jgi:hypothetical protein
MQKFIDVEYIPNSGILHIVKKLGQEYHGVVTRPSDGFTCLALCSAGASRKHYIEVSRVEAITVNGRRQLLTTDPDRWRTRAEEIRYLVDGQCADWAMAPIMKLQHDQQIAKSRRDQQKIKDDAVIQQSGCIAPAALIVFIPLAGLLQAIVK